MATKPNSGKLFDKKGRYVRISIFADQKIRDKAAKLGTSYIRALDALLEV